MNMNSATEESCERLRTIAKLAYRDADEAVGIIEVVEAGNTETSIKALQGRDCNVQALIRAALVQRLLMSIMRMHDKPSSDRETFPRAFELLDKASVYAAIVSVGDKDILDRARLRWQAIRGDPMLAVIRNSRDFDLAHAIPSKADAARPRYGEFFRMARETIKLAEELAAGTGVCSVSLDGARVIWARRAAEYWSDICRSGGDIP